MSEDFEDAFRSHHLAEKTTDEPLIRVMALHALAYCERLFYLEEVEEIRVADANVYSGRRLHEEVDKGPDIYSVELASERLGIRGKVDCARRDSGEIIVVEHKKGRSNKGKEAWPSDRLQVLAYALLLAEHRSEPVPEAFIQYHANRKRIAVSVEPGDAEAEVCAAVARARELRASLERPPVSVPESRCRTCSLAPVCLPEEERFAEQSESKPRRLFPADTDRRIVHVVEQGASVRRDGEQLIIYLPDGTKKPLPGLTVGGLVLHGNIQVSTQSIHFCAANDIGVHWLSFGGHYVGALSPTAGGIQRRSRQYRALSDTTVRARLASQLVLAKIENQLRYLLRTTRGRERDDGLGERLDGLRAVLKRVGEIGTRIASEGPTRVSEADAEALIGTLRGHEGMASRIYFGLLPRILNLEQGDLLYFDGRNRRPPKDPFNALLSFGYALLYRDTMAAVLAVGLEPSVGFSHTPRSAAYPLALDLMELFRQILWDVPLIGSVNRKQWKEEDFDITSGQVWLSADGRRKAIQLYEARKQEKWKHPVLNYSLSYARTVELEARLLEKEWTGERGLFARLRLR